VKQPGGLIFHHPSNCVEFAKQKRRCENLLPTGVLGITFLEVCGLVSGSILSVLGLALLYKGASRKEAKELI